MYICTLLFPLEITYWNCYCTQALQWTSISVMPDSSSRNTSWGSDTSGSFTWCMQPVIATQRSALGHLKPVHGLSNRRKISCDKLPRACSEAMQGKPCSRKHRRFPLGRCYRSTAWAGASSVQIWRLTGSFLKSEYSFWITANSPCLYWCLTANVTSSRRERKAKGPTCSETWLTSAVSRMGSGETRILNFSSNWGSLPDPAMSRPTLLAQNWEQHMKEEVPLPPPWPSPCTRTGGTGCAGKAQGPNNPSQQTPPQDSCTHRGHQRCHRPAQSQEKPFQQHTGNRHCMCCFYKLQQTTTFGWVFFPLTNSWNLLTPISVWLYSSLHSSGGAQTTKYPERYFLIIGAFCQILYCAFPVWITAFKSVGFPLASSLLQSQHSPKKEFTEN